MSTDLDFGLHWDRDYSINVAKISRIVYLPIVTLLVHPAVIYVVLTKSSMSADYKLGYVCHTVLEMCFDVYNCLLHQMYILAPYPIIMCTGLLCDSTTDPAKLLVVLTFWTAAVCLPYMFLMLRMHQGALYAEHALKVSARAQALALLIIAATLFSNVLGTNLWAVDIPHKWEQLKRNDVSWALNYTSNFLVMGEDIGDVDQFKNELFIIICTIFIDFSFYVFLTYHAIYKLGKHTNHLTPPTHKAQLRLVHSLTIQAIASFVFFISPLVLLFLGLNTSREQWESRPTLAAVFRLLFLMLFSLSPLSNSLIFLARDPWCRKMIKRRGSTVSSLSLGQPILPTSDLELIAARNRSTLKRASLP